MIPTNPLILCHTALKVPIGRTPAAGRSQPSVLTSAMTPGVLDPTRRTNLINHETIVVTVLQCPFHVQRGGALGKGGSCHCAVLGKIKVGKKFLVSLLQDEFQLPKKCLGDYGCP